MYFQINLKPLVSKPAVFTATHYAALPQGTSTAPASDLFCHLISADVKRGLFVEDEDDDGGS